jgi:hypothetical protein
MVGLAGPTTALGDRAAEPSTLRPSQASAGRHSRRSPASSRHGIELPLPFRRRAGVLPPRSQHRDQGRGRGRNGATPTTTYGMRSEFERPHYEPGLELKAILIRCNCLHRLFASTESNSTGRLLSSNLAGDGTSANGRPSHWIGFQRNNHCINKPERPPAIAANLRKFRRDRAIGIDLVRAAFPRIRKRPDKVRSALERRLP